MFEAWLPLKTPLERLMWLKRRIGGGASWVWRTITGAAPLTLPNAVHHAIKSLTQYGLCTQSTTPTPSAPVDIVCNNGALRVNRLDIGNVVNGYYWSPTGVYTETTAARLSNTIPVKRGDVIAVTTATVRSGTLNIRYNQFDDSGNWVLQTVYAQYSNAPHTEYITIAQDGFFNFSGNYIVSQSSYVDWDNVVIINTTDPVFADGTSEVLTVLANQNTDPTIIKATLASGTTDVRYNATSSCIVAPVKPNTVYTIGFLEKPTGGSIFRVVTTKGLVSSSAQSVASIAYDLDMNNYATKTLNSGNEAAWMYVQLSNTMSAETFASIIIQEGNAIMPPQTVTDIPMLLGVGDTKDEGEIISGGVTHRIGCHVFDGTETFSKSSAYGKAFLISAASAAWGADRTKEVLCTHFLGLPQTKSSQEDNTCFFNQTGHFYFRVTDNSDTDAFKAWLSEQYASGSPVIVWFVLAEETTEQGTPHALHTSAGTNVVDVTANVSPVELEVEYASTQAFGFGNPNAGTEEENEGEGNE